MSYQQYPAHQGYGAPPGPPPPQNGGHYYQPPGQYNGGYQQYGYQPPPPQHSPYPPQGSPYPPQGSPYPPQQGNYPPPNQHYPPQQYNAPPPPPQNGYGAPPGPPPGPYGAPPPPSGQYGVPPAGPPQSYANPPPQHYGPPTPPSLGYGPPQMIQWDAKPDAQALRSAMKGLGTDEKALIRALSTKDPLQIEELKSAYFRTFSRSLEKDVISETGGWFEKGLVAIIQGPLLHDCHLLYSAMDGPGTKEKVLNDVLLGRSNADLHAIKSKYRSTFGKKLEDAVRGDLSMKTERHFMIVLGANRAENNAPVVPQDIDRDVMDLYRATEGKVGTDEMMVCSILSTRNDNQIRAINNAYFSKFQKKLERVIRNEFSGHMEAALLYQLHHAVDKYMHAADLLEDAMAGLGTKDHLLISRVVRYHWNRVEMANIKGAYQQKYKRSLSSRIKGETRGDYERLMVACIGD
ncbi:uncharacterized protein BCR38DRAFT_238202 [Pseudomassariella vexata]|uniref:Annexin n=1 Tax=Pseudomassariella vexata TaxID=1141098 RepID=A0A1Y2DUL6_9PEZI|nr:uncharacterized protein BCR38DRAFT_238202 [Pseudomassariella vexata]ORY62345.1 hypothetical protein BCR38DRAFT_238202 [Pseudomassariella vexata]